MFPHWNMRFCERFPFSSKWQTRRSWNELLAQFQIIFVPSKSSLNTFTLVSFQSLFSLTIYLLPNFTPISLIPSWSLLLDFFRKQGRKKFKIKCWCSLIMGGVLERHPQITLWILWGLWMEFEFHAARNHQFFRFSFRRRINRGGFFSVSKLQKANLKWL